MGRLRDYFIPKILYSRTAGLAGQQRRPVVVDDVNEVRTGRFES